MIYQETVNYVICIQYYVTVTKNAIKTFTFQSKHLKSS